MMNLLLDGVADLFCDINFNIVSLSLVDYFVGSAEMVEGSPARYLQVRDGGEVIEPTGLYKRYTYTVLAEVGSLCSTGREVSKSTVLQDVISLSEKVVDLVLSKGKFISELIQVIRLKDIVPVGVVKTINDVWKVGRIIRFEFVVIRSEEGVVDES